MSCGLDNCCYIFHKVDDPHEISFLLYKSTTLNSSRLLGSYRNRKKSKQNGRAKKDDKEIRRNLLLEENLVRHLGDFG